MQILALVGADIGCSPQGGDPDRGTSLTQDPGGTSAGRGREFGPIRAPYKWAMRYPMILLAGLSVVAGFAGIGTTWGFKQWVHFGPVEPEAFSFGLAGLSVLVGLAGIGLGYVLYATYRERDPIRACTPATLSKIRWSELSNPIHRKQQATNTNSLKKSRIANLIMCMRIWSGWRSAV